MLERFYQSSVLFYINAFDFITFLVVLGEWAGFVVITHWVMDIFPWWIAPLMVVLFGGAWLILYEAVTFDLVAKYGILKGITL